MDLEIARGCAQQTDTYEMCSGNTPKFGWKIRILTKIKNPHGHHGHGTHKIYNQRHPLLRVSGDDLQLLSFFEKPRVRTVTGIGQLAADLTLVVDFLKEIKSFDWAKELTQSDSQSGWCPQEPPPHAHSHRVFQLRSCDALRSSFFLLLSSLS